MTCARRGWPHDHAQRAGAAHGCAARATAGRPAGPGARRLAHPAAAAPHPRRAARHPARGGARHRRPGTGRARRPVRRQPALHRPKGCLPRSLGAALLCRLRGTWPTWCAGVRVVPPFTAHAWIEAEGSLVGEGVPDGYFARLVTVEPSSR
ncbi:lasso peptide biosynthesis B2 protein [Streptomyces werraensis]|uniref:lasso peptide biosynthesis B2 protein n=1 Tax=Streptomyces werraensis TaxID=68284 RepID=UPI0037D41395